jgi:amino acid transporter
MITDTAELSALRPRAVGTVVSTVFALASTAPAYSLAVTAGLLAALVGGWSALVLVVSAIPVTLVVLSFRELNAAEADCGTCFAWVTRAFGSVAGWLTGWVTIAAGVLVTTSLVQAAAIYAYTVVGASGLAESRPAQAALGLVLLGVMSYLAHRGITVAARTQLVLFGAELVALLAVIVAALLAEPLPVSSAAGHGPEKVEISALAAAALVTVFLYWGWDSSFSVNEESTDPTATPARSALLAMGVLVVLYAGFAAAVTAWAGVDRLAAIGEEDLFAELGTSLLGAPGGTLLAGAVLVSALASVQTTLLPAARSAFSMARRRTLPIPLARVSHSGGPSVATWSLAALTGVVYLALLLTSDAVLADSVAATAVLVAAYYGITCLAVPFAFGRDMLARPVRRIVVPLLAAAIFAGVLVASAADLTTISVLAVLVTTGIGVVVFAVCHRLNHTRVRSEDHHE